MNKEEFRKVPSEEFISVSQDGQVINSETGHPISIFIDENDGPFIKITNSIPGTPFRRPTQVRRFVSDMVNEAFPRHEPKPCESKMIRINNVPMTREALLQIQRTKGRHYPGPLRDQTIWDLIDYLLKELDS